MRAMPDEPIPVPYFLARPAGPPPWPGVVVLMEAPGISAQLLRVCERLAHEGYAAAAPDLFHRQGGTDPDHWQEFVPLLRDDESVADIAATVAALRDAGASAVGVTGFCMGGRLSYRAAVAGLDIQAAVGFYGSNISQLLGTPNCPFLLFYGGKDPYIPMDEVEKVRAHHPDEVIVYPDADHGFMRDGSDSYHPEAAADAWPRLLGFFAQHLA